LRRDQWSEGVAQVATEQGLQAASFDQAARAYSRAVGAEISDDSIRRITQDFGERIGARRSMEVERVYELGPEGAKPEAEIEEVAPIEGQANISSDGVMILFRERGWREVKLAVISRCEVLAAEKRKKATQRRREDPLVKLQDHSYQAGLWDADTMARYQYVEGLRRGLHRCAQLSSVNDAAAWILRITRDNFPQAEIIVDWSHAQERVWTVAHEAFGQGTPRAQQWAESHVDTLWEGQAWQVAQAITNLSIQRDAVRQAQGYFASHHQCMHYDHYRAAGYPIGSGTVESGCKNIVPHRMKRPGRGWGTESGQAMLSALSELHSGRFDTAWQLCS
jgi:hypothetical protein